MRVKALLFLQALAQALLLLRVVRRMLKTARGERLLPATALTSGESACLSILLPVLNEYQRLAPCLDGLLAQGDVVAEILVVDGGSHDGTLDLVHDYMQRDARIRLVDASPIPPGWNGKTWGLHCGCQQVTPTSDWILTIDADVRPAAVLAASLLAHTRKTGLVALSVATLQEIRGNGLGLLHPALLTTLIYRFGIPGRSIDRIAEVQANGQCFLCQRSVLERCGGFSLARTSLCEDVTIARAFVAAGYPVGFYEAGELVRVQMYQDWRDAWQNWTRSLPLHDHFSGAQTLYGWLELALIQALPLPLFCALALQGKRHRLLLLLNGICVVIRAGVLFGTARAYDHRPWTYWLSPLCDIPVVLKLGQSALQRRHSWRGRTIVRGGSV